MGKIAEAVCWSLVLFVLLQVSAAHAIWRYSPWPWPTLLATIPLYALALLLVSNRSWPLRVLDTPWPGLVLIAGVWAATLKLYPYVKSLPNPPTSDTAMIAPIQALKMGRAMYDLAGLIPVPASPGPGWVLANAPFSFLGQSWLYTLMTPVYLAIGVIGLRAAGHSMRLANAWLLLLFSSLLSWEMSMAGADLIPMSIVIMALYLMVERWCLGPATLATIGIAILVGLFGTARIVMPALAPIFALLIWKHDRVHAVLFMAVALAVTVAVHAVFYFQVDVYSPFHLVDRARSRMGPIMMAAGAAATLAIAALALIFMKRTSRQHLGWFTALLAAPFLFISAGELIGAGFDFRQWEGRNYLIPIFASAFLLILRRMGADLRKSEPASAT